MLEKNPQMTAGEKKKFVMKPPQASRVGTKKTAFTNFAEICRLWVQFCPLAESRAFLHVASSTYETSPSVQAEAAAEARDAIPASRDGHFRLCRRHRPAHFEGQVPSEALRTGAAKVHQ